MKTYVVAIEGRDHTVRVDGQGSVSVDGGEWHTVVRQSTTEFFVTAGGRATRVVAIQEDVSSVRLLAGGRILSATVESERSKLLKQYARSTGTARRKTDVYAPMPALVVRVEVEVGQEVAAGQGLLVLEAMKMENEIRAHQAGRVKSIHVQQGKPVEKGELLVVLE